MSFGIIGAVLSFFVYIFIAILRVFIYIFKRPLLCDFLLVWAYVGSEICFDKYMLNWIFCILIGFAAAALITLLMAKIKYIGWAAIAAFGLFWGYEWYIFIMSRVKDSLPQAAPFIAVFVGFAFFLYHTYYGIIQGRDFFGEPLNIFSPIKALYDKIIMKKEI